MFDEKGPGQRRNERSGTLQKTELRRAWADLSVVYPRPEGRPVRPVPNGVDLSSRVPCEILKWCKTTTGEWVGWVCLPVRDQADGVPGEVRYVYQYVPAAALSPRDELHSERPPGTLGPT